jgi:adenylate cyclase class IV
MEEFKELEFKYKADAVSLVSFVNLMNEVGYKVRKDVSSWDHYYTHADTKEEFLRFRDSDRPELTIKRKVKSTNNWERVEIDLPLDPTRVNKKTVDSWTSLEGYANNFTIYKSCFIFWQDLINMVYYVVYDEDMKEKGRFIEIEVNKDKVQGIGIETAFQQLKEMEKKLTALGINPQNRLKKSLFEIFVK